MEKKKLIVVMEMRDKTEFEKIKDSVGNYADKAISAFKDLASQTTDEIKKYNISLSIDFSDKDNPFKFKVNKK